MLLPLTHPLLGTWPTTQACALTGNQTVNPLVYRLALNPLSYTNQGSFTKFLMSLYLAALSRWQVKFTTDTLGVGTEKAMPVNFPFNSGMTLPTALVVPVETGIMFRAAPRPSCHSFPEGPSKVFWVSVMAWSGHESLHHAKVVMMALAGDEPSSGWYRRHC